MAPTTEVGTSISTAGLLYRVAGPLCRGRAAVQARAGHHREGAGPRPPRRRRCRSTTWPSCIAPRAATPRPSRCIKRALAIAEKALGPDHPDVGAASTTWPCCTEPGPLRRGRAAVQAGLAITEKALGPDHPVGTALNNLALLYQPGPLRRGRAAVQARRSPSREGAGPRPPRRRRPRSTTWPSCTRQGRYAEAEPLYQRAWPSARRRWAPTTPTSAPSLNNLAGLYDDQGRYAEAEPLYKRALAIPRRRWAPTTPTSAPASTTWPCCTATQGRYAEAEPLYKRALAIREKALGPDHPDVGSLPQQPGRAVPRPGPLRRGRAAVQRSLAIREKALGPDHPDVGTSRSTTWPCCTKPRAAMPRPSRCTSAPRHLREGAGPRPPRSVGTALNNLAALYFAQRHWARAADYWRRSTAYHRAPRPARHGRVGQALTGKGKSEAEQSS